MEKKLKFTLEKSGHKTNRFGKKKKKIRTYNLNDNIAKNLFTMLINICN